MPSRLLPYLFKDEPTPGEIYRARGACSKCGAPGPLKQGALIVTVKLNDIYDDLTVDRVAETQRFCSRCAPVMKDALMELGFTFGLVPR